MATSLSTREKQFVTIGAIVAVGLLLLVLVILPLQDKMNRMDRRITALQRQLSEAQELQAEYRQLQKRLTGSEQRLQKGRTFSLFQFMEGVASGQVTPEQLVYLRPKPDQTQEDLKISALEVRFQNLDLGQIVRLLRRLETAPAVVRVKSMSMKKRFDNKELMDLEMTVSAYSQVGG